MYRFPLASLKAGSGLLEASLGFSKVDGQMDRRTYRFPLYSTRLCPLQYPLGPLPCLHKSHHSEILKQGKGTDDHLLPLGDWFMWKMIVNKTSVYVSIRKSTKQNKSKQGERGSRFVTSRSYT